jgi:HD superfamily phosphohydrolase
MSLSKEFVLPSRPHVMNDPIHLRISYSDAEKEIIDHPLFQRLRRLKQLSCVYFVFTSAHHTRFEHSLGVMFIATKYTEHLFKGRPEKDYMVQVVRLAALLHDSMQICVS